MRLPAAVAGGLVLAAAVMLVLAFTTGDDGDERSATPATTATQPSAGQAHTGLAVWVAQGCGSCHTLAAANARGTFAPDLGETLAGVPAAAIRQSIVAPNADSAAGYTAGMMPDTYGSKITPGDLDRLVAFLRASAR